MANPAPKGKKVAVVLGFSMTRHYGAVSVTFDAKADILVSGKGDMEAYWGRLVANVHDAHDKYQKEHLHDATVQAERADTRQQPHAVEVITVPVSQILYEEHDGKPALKPKGGQWAKWGVMMYPEFAVKSPAMQEIGDRKVWDVQDWEMDVEVIGGKPKRVVRLERTAQSES